MKIIFVWSFYIIQSEDMYALHTRHISFFSRLASSGSRRGGVQNSEHHVFCLIWHSAVNAQMLVENISIDEGSVVFIDFLFKFPRPGFAPTCLAAKVRRVGIICLSLWCSFTIAMSSQHKDTRIHFQSTKLSIIRDFNVVFFLHEERQLNGKKQWKKKKSPLCVFVHYKTSWPEPAL